MEKTKAARVLIPGVVPNPKARLLDQVREVIRVKHYSIRTEEAYVITRGRERCAVTMPAKPVCSGQ